MSEIPEKQCAVQLVGPDKLTLNDSKKVHRPGKYQILCKVEVTGLCFSDLKLLKQFSSHVRKSEIISGIDTSILKEIPSYVPGLKPTVPGHETVVRIVEIGDEVKNIRLGGRYLVQADYRWLLTENSNGAFGYNCEGGLQEYVLMDTRIITSPDGESMLLAASEKLSASAIALVEPWACVEEAYASTERTTLKSGGRMLIVADVDVNSSGLEKLFSKYGKPAQIKWISKTDAPKLSVQTEKVENISAVEEAGYDDVIYFGSNPETAESLFSKTASHGLFNMVLCSGRFGRDIAAQAGRVHYGGIRIIGTTGSEPAESMEYIPKNGEIRRGDRINVIGAAGPMGMMHVIRNICQGIDDVTVFAGDVDDNRLANLAKIAEPVAEKNGIKFKIYNAGQDNCPTDFDYTALMAPIPALVAGAVKSSAKRAIINIFAGIAATVTAEIDMDMYIEKQLYLTGTSGSTLEDMKQVLAKVESGRLDTNTSVAAICGLEHAAEGIRAVEKRTIAGKIVVYPACKDMPLTTLEQLKEKIPEVAGCLYNGLWTKKAEETLMELYKNQEKGL